MNTVVNGHKLCRNRKCKWIHKEHDGAILNAPFIKLLLLYLKYYYNRYELRIIECECTFLIEKLIYKNMYYCIFVNDNGIKKTQTDLIELRRFFIRGRFAMHGQGHVQFHICANGIETYCNFEPFLRRRSQIATIHNQIGEQLNMWFPPAKEIDSDSNFKRTENACLLSIIEMWTHPIRFKCQMWHVTSTS